MTQTAFTIYQFQIPHRGSKVLFSSVYVFAHVCSYSIAELVRLVTYNQRSGVRFLKKSQTAKMYLKYIVMRKCKYEQAYSCDFVIQDQHNSIAWCSIAVIQWHYIVCRYCPGLAPSIK